jgi:beta-N-acetylhexosaminidase
MSAVRRFAFVTLAALTASTALVAPATSAPPTDDSPGARALAQMRGMSLEDKVGQMFTLFAYGSGANQPDARNTALYGVATPAEVIRKYKPGGWIYFSARGNIQDPVQLATYSNDLQRVAMQTGLRVPLQIAVDQEQGLVTRIGPPATQFGGNMAQGASRSVADARTVGAITGREIRAMGIHQNYSPVADVNTNPLNPVIGVRSFSSDPKLVSDLTVAMATGLERDGKVIATAKHFPGHGDTKDDSHFKIPEVNHTKEQWYQLDAPPFKAAIKAGIDSIMTAHVVVKSLDPSGDPATLSKPIMTDILRKEFGFKGVIVTDALEMAGVRAKYGDAEAVVRAIEAGGDQLLLPPAPDLQFKAVLDAVRSGRISESRINESVFRILLLKLTRGILFQPFVDPAKVPAVVGTPENLATAQRITDKTTTLIKNGAGVLPLSKTPRNMLVTGWGVTTTRLLSEKLTARGATVTVRETGASPTDAAIADAVAKAQANDVVVVTTMKAWDTTVTDIGAKQQALVKALLATGKPVITVAVRDPYDIAYYNDAQTHVATYSYTPVALESLVKVLYGEVAPTGKLPVTIPIAGRPDTALYPFGHGLTW